MIFPTVVRRLPACLSLCPPSVHIRLHENAPANQWLCHPPTHPCNASIARTYARAYTERSYLTLSGSATTVYINEIPSYDLPVSPISSSNFIHDDDDTHTLIYNAIHASRNDPPLTHTHTHTNFIVINELRIMHACILRTGTFEHFFWISGQDGTGRNETPSTGICAAGMETLRDLLTTTTTVYPVLDP
jgi:hypothetical protein